MKNLPIKKTKKYDDQISVKITKLDKEDVVFLQGCGIDTGELFRRCVLDTIKDAKKIIEREGLENIFS